MKLTWYQLNKAKKQAYDKERRQFLKDQLNEQRRLDYKTNPEKYRKYHKDLWRNNTEREKKRNLENYANHKEVRQQYYKQLFVRYKLAKRVAAKRNFVFEIPYEIYEAMITECHYCKNDLLCEFGYCLDRLDHKQGYLLSNVVPCCGRCNRSRGDRYTPEEWMVMITALVAWKRRLS